MKLLAPALTAALLFGATACTSVSDSAGSAKSGASVNASAGKSAVPTLDTSMPSDSSTSSASSDESASSSSSDPMETSSTGEETSTGGFGDFHECTLDSAGKKLSATAIGISCSDAQKLWDKFPEKTSEASTSDLSFNGDTWKCSVLGGQSATTTIACSSGKKSLLGSAKKS